MPPQVVKTPAQEKRWKEAKKAVKEQTKKKESEFDDQDWATVMTIFKKMTGK